MILSLLHVSAITMAAGVNQVSVTWGAAKQTQDGIGHASLTAALDISSLDSSPAAAMVEISLDAAEAAALSWPGLSIGEEMLTGEATQPETPESPDSSPNPDDLPSDVVDGGSDPDDLPSDVVGGGSGPDDLPSDVVDGGSGPDDAPSDIVGGGSDPDDLPSDVVGGGSGPDDLPSDIVDGDSGPDDLPSDVVGGGSGPDDLPSDVVVGGSDPDGLPSDVVGGGSDPDGLPSDVVGGGSDPDGLPSDVVDGGTSPDDAPSDVVDVSDLSSLTMGDLGTSVLSEQSTPILAQTTVLSETGNTSGLSSVLIQRADGGAVLRFLLTKSTPYYAEELTFSVLGQEDLTVDVTEADIRIWTYASETEIPDITKALLLQGSNSVNNTVVTAPFTVYRTLPSEIVISSPNSSPVILDGDGNKTIAYFVNLQNLPDDSGQIQTPKVYPFTLTLPLGLSLPQGTVSLADNSIVCNSQTLGAFAISDANLDGIADATVENLSLTPDGLAFTCTLSNPALSTAQIILTVDAGAFLRSPDEINDTMTLSSINSSGETVQTAVPVMASNASLPGDGDGYIVEALDTNASITQTVAWADNQNESGIRPVWGWGSQGLSPRVYFTINNGVRTELTEDTLKNVGLSDFPSIAQLGSNMVITGLPQQIKEKDSFGGETIYDVTWSVEPPIAIPDGYAFVNVTKENIDQYQSASVPGWYYVLQRTFDITLEAKKDGVIPLTPEEVVSILSNFEFQWTYGTTSENASVKYLLDNGYASLAENGGKVTVSGLWKYNLDGSPITFRITELPDGELGSGDGILSQDELPAGNLLTDGDWFQIHYDNSKVANHGQETTAVYSGGTLRLLLSGTTTFSAEKRWLDSNPAAGLDSRPDTTFTLWRYREGQTASTAAQVPGVSAVFLNSGSTTSPQYNEDSGYHYYEITFVDATGTPIALPKYDPDGYAYIYGVKEEMLYGDGDNSYETIYGVVGENDQIVVCSDILPDNYTGGSQRAPGDTLLYNSGTLSNRLKGTTQATAVKKWEAAAYQSQFEDVAVKLVLQSRVENGDWSNVLDDDGQPVIQYLYNFTAQRLTENYTAYPSEYNVQGQKLTYRWVESALYQGVTATTDAQVQEQIDSGVATEVPIAPDGSFTLWQQGIPVNYYSQSTIVQSPSGSVTTITNRIDDCIDYHVEKTWEENTTKKAVALSIYQINSGSSDVTLTTPYITFEFDEEGILLPDKTVCADPHVTVVQGLDEDSRWHASVSGLPRFDANGRPYEYLLLEAKGNFPTYTTTRDPSGDYTTVVYNGGSGRSIPVLVRKVWLDDGDDLHREPVTFTAYNAVTNQPVETSSGDPLTITLQDGLWHEILLVPAGNGIEDADDIYIVETSMGSATVNHHLASEGDEDGNFTKEALYTKNAGTNGEIFDVTSENHRYQVTYQYKKTDAASDPGGVQGSFVVTNRRLGFIDLTVNKIWVDGEGELNVVGQMASELQTIFQQTGDKLALVFQLKFADPSNESKPGWGITYSGIDAKDDSVRVGGEEVFILDQDGIQASSEQVILGLDKLNTPLIDNTSHFFNLPKYDSTGHVVEYTVEEIWLDITHADSATAPKVLTDSDLQANYPDLWELWKDYDITYDMTYHSDVEDHNAKDRQTLDVTNSRSGVKDVVWYKQWKDDFTYNSDLRPDIYLDIYRVVHVPDTVNGGYRRQIETVQANVKWTAPTDSYTNWTVTLPGVQKYDAYGFEILYYGVERTVVSVGDYDYQAVKYSLDGADMGNRDHPTPSAVSSGNVLNLLDESLWKNGVPADLKNSIGTFENGGTPQYALVEKGTFTNTLSQNYSIEGMKYWTSLPSGWQEARLPSVKFTVFRSAAGEPAEQAATLTISSDQWESLKSGLSYRYLIEYEGNNTLRVNPDGSLSCNCDGNAIRLSRYDDYGRLYTYIVEESVIWESGNLDADQVYDMTGSDFTFNNQYKPATGAITVKKHLYLPRSADGTVLSYPAVTFRLTRQLHSELGYVDDPTFEAEKILSSAQVLELYHQLDDAGKAEGLVTATLEFADLPLYAPDGTEYHYTVTEDKAELQGYDTWAAPGDKNAGDFGSVPGAAGDVSVPDLTPKTDGSIQATFLNRRNSQQEFPSFTATKVWQDFMDRFGFRPGQEKFETLLTLMRTAASQTEQENDMTEPVACLIEWTSAEQDDTWTFTIKPLSGETGFEKFAPNGMPWVYTLSEELTDDGRLKLNSTDLDAEENRVYSPTPNTGRWSSLNSTGSNTDFGKLTNSVQTAAHYKKAWLDAQGRPISQDYLGVDVSVTFTLQVSTNDGTTWENAASNQLVQDAMGPNFTGTVTKTGRINDAGLWSGSFAGLPAVVADGSGYIFLKYRVVETQLQCGSAVQTVSLPQSGTDGPHATSFAYVIAGNGPVISASFSQGGTTSTSTNQLSTIDVTVTKVWFDENNQYNTRPGISAPMTWTSWFVLQRSTNGVDWENVDVVSLYGGNTRESSPASARWEFTFTGLPSMDYAAATAASYSYRVRELQPRDGGYTLLDVTPDAIVPENGVYNPAGSIAGSAYDTVYQSTGNAWVVTNTLDLYEIPGPETQNIRAVKIWAVPDSDTSPKPDVVFELQYRTAIGTWAPVPFPAAQKTVNATVDWTAEWLNLPSTINGAPVGAYRVVEVVPADAGWVQTAQQAKVVEGIYTFTFTNTFTRTFTVQKAWNPSDAVTSSVTLGLFRTIDPNAVGSVSGEAVPISETNPASGRLTVVLSNPWTHTFTGLPTYDTNSQTYFYYALELDGNGNPVVQGGSVSLGGKDYVVSYATDHDNTVTVVTNTPATDLTGTKTWMDDSNQGSGRPNTLTLVLERRAGSSQTWAEVLGVTPAWSNTETNVWTYRYTGLPQYDSTGERYEYRVREIVPGGYQLLHQSGTPGLVNPDSTGSYHFVNVRTDAINLYVSKTWIEGPNASRPANITLKLERRALGETTWTDITSLVPQPAWTGTESGDTWYLTYENLPQFDSRGVRYEYRVTELSAPSGYEKLDSTNTDPTLQYRLENIQLGNIAISKKVSGNLGEPDRIFHFTVTLSGVSRAGTEASAITGAYSATYTDQSGTETVQTIQFEQGVSEAIALKHGESVVIHGLGAGLNYAVTEHEANQDGYYTSATGASGTVPVGDTATSTFENYRNTGIPEERINISGTKTWVDDSNASGKRPASLTLVLYRSTPGGTETAVQATPVWNQTGDVWYYTYYNLPKYDENGQLYIYRVVEIVPEGYVGQANGFHFTNTLAEEFVTLKGHKQWVGDDPEERPQFITVVLYADGLEVARTTVSAADDWSYLFEDVPKYDADGNEIAYSVQELDVPDGYEVHYDGLNIVNQKDVSLGSLAVSKRVAGPGAERDRAFRFTVTLSDPSVNGTYGGMTFVNGVATFTLKHGQSTIASDLPSGLSYTVTEEAVEGYSVSSSNASGSIVAGQLVESRFVNTSTQDWIVPPTGDSSNMALYCALCTLFAVGLIATLWMGKAPCRRRKK